MELLETYAQQNSLDVNENANRYPGPTGFFSYVLESRVGDLLLKQLPAWALRLHSDGYIYIHKLPYSLYIPYCTGHSVARLLERGLVTPTVSSRPARHFDTFVDHVANYLVTLQHYFTGAQALTGVEWYAGPFIRRDGLGYREVKQNIQRLIYNLNYPTRVGLQTPFTNFTIVLDASRSLLREPAVHCGVRVDPLECFRDEAVVFVRALAEVLYEGDSSGRPFTFPIPTLMTTARELWENPELYEVVFRTAAHRGSFYWLNTRVVDPDTTFSMCCRLTVDRGPLALRLHPAPWWRGPGGVWSIPEVTGSLNVVTVNLPRLALESRGDDARFWEGYGRVLGEARRLGEWFRQRYTKLVSSYPRVYSMIRVYLWEFPHSHYCTIGLVGLPEAAAILMGDPQLWFEGSRRARLQATELMKRMVEFAVARTREWMGETGTPWNVEEVPGESAAVKLALKDAKRFPQVLEYLPDPGNPVYSTSIAPYYAPLTLYERVEVESRVQKYFTGGVMMHIFLGEEADPDALAKLTRRLTETDLVYWSYTPAITHCPKCGRTFTGLYTECPACKSEGVEVWSRIVGYYRPLVNWSPQRRREFKTRRHYTIHL